MTASSRALAPIAAGLLGLAGSLAATVFLYRTASSSVDRVLEERLRGAGETAAELFARVDPTAEALRAVMAANGLEGAYALSPSLQVLADATGPGGGAADLLRVDGARAARALGGTPSLAFGYAVGDLRVATAYFPVRGQDARVRSVLVLEAGQGFAAARSRLTGALWAGVGLSVVAALALGALAWRWSRAEERHLRAAERAARADALARMAAMAAHEIRNPLGVIRGAVELVRARSGVDLAPRDQHALADVLGEVERLRRLTEDLLDVAREPELAVGPVDLAEVAREAALSLERVHPEVVVRTSVQPLPVEGDPARLRQVLGNLLLNAAQAGAQRIELRGAPEAGSARLEVRDDGPGVAEAMRARLFEPFATGRAAGKGLGLAIAKRIVVRHGGSLALVPDGRPGATFELRMPLRPG